MLNQSLSSFVLVSMVLLASNRGDGQQPSKEPTSKKKTATKTSDEDIVTQYQYQALVAKLTPAQQAWERLLQENLGSFYLPIHQREMVGGVAISWYPCRAIRIGLQQGLSPASLLGTSFQFTNDFVAFPTLTSDNCTIYFLFIGTSWWTAGASIFRL